MTERAGALLLLLALGCTKSEAGRQREVQSCSAINSKAEEIAQCLVTRYDWDAAEAHGAAQVRQRELDSTMAWLEDSAWNADSLAHGRAVRECQSGIRRGDLGASNLETCLLLRFGWEERRAVATTDSLWARDAARHRREVRDCAGHGVAGSASCLMLRYGWPTQRAQAVYDSLLRASSR